MKKLTLVIAVLIVVFGIIRYAVNTAPVESEQLVVTGSATLAPLVQNIAEHYHSLHPAAQIAIQPNDSMQGIADVRQGTADIGMVSREPAQQEADLNWFTLGRDGLAIIVHQANPVTALTDEQIAAVFMGKISHWNAVGGDSAAISTVNTAEGSSNLAVFLNHFRLKAGDLAKGLIAGDNEQVITAVAGDHDAIGYASLSRAERMRKQGAAIKLLPLDAVTATLGNVRSGRYPLVWTLNLVTRSAPQGLAQRFIRYALSPAAARLIEDHGFIPAAK